MEAIDTGKTVFNGKSYIRYAASTDTGCVRTNNEDSYSVFPDNSLFCLGDGVGGLEAGEVASEKLISTLSVCLKRYQGKQRSLRNKITSFFRKAESNSVNIVQLLQTANSAIYKHSQELQKKMATTAVVLQAQGDELTVVHAGDSRAYLLRNRLLGQLTMDHTLFMELLSTGTSVSANDKMFPKHVITKALGTKQDLDPDEIKLKWVENDIFLLCSDGLTDMLTDEDICRICLIHYPAMQDITSELISAAKKAGGRDNITIIVGHIE